MKNLYSFLFLLVGLSLQSQTIVDVVVNSPDHEILEEAVIAADLAATLSGEGPFTLFAPTDDAFNALPEGTIETLLQNPSGMLTDILLYHAVAGLVLSSDLSDGMTATTINGRDITVTINDTGVFINDAMVTLADITTENGVVHVIDAVLIPPRNTVVDVIVNSPDHETLEAAVIAANLAETLSGNGPFTVFAPTDEAFNALPEGTLETLLEEPSGALTDILLYHVILESVLSTDLVYSTTAETLNGEILVITVNENSILINESLVTIADITTDNGVVHVIDAVLLPSTITSTKDVITDNLSFSVFPNPFVDAINVSSKNSSTWVGDITLYSNTGEVIRQWNQDALHKDISTTDIPSGMYILTIESEDQIEIIKLVKQ